MIFVAALLCATCGKDKDEQKPEFSVSPATFVSVAAGADKNIAVTVTVTATGNWLAASCGQRSGYKRAGLFTQIEII